MNVSQELQSFAKELSILVVEDDKLLNEQLSELCSLFFKKVISAYDGQEGLALYKKEKVDVVMSDITMPLMNGVELTKKIKYIDDEQSILILSAHNEVNYMIDLIDIGIRQFVHKPFDDQELLYRLLKVCEHVALTKQSIENLSSSFAKLKTSAKIETTPFAETQKVQEEQKVEKKQIIQEEIILPISDVTQSISHARIDSQSFINTLKNDATSWQSLQDDIAIMVDLLEDFEHYVGFIYTDEITKDVLTKIASILRKFYTILSPLEAMAKMSLAFFELATFLEDTPFETLSSEQRKKFKILEFIYDDIARFVETVFLYRDTLDIFYLEDSLISSITQLRQNVLGIQIEEEELELF
jgi:YesN/AraC family two-component response regulator